MFFQASSTPSGTPADSVLDGFCDFHTPNSTFESSDDEELEKTPPPGQTVHDDETSSGGTLYQVAPNGGMEPMSTEARRMRRSLAKSGCLGSGFPSYISPASPGVPRDMGTQTYSLVNPNYRPPARNRPAPLRPTDPPPPGPNVTAGRSESSSPLFSALGKRVKRDLISAAQATGKAVRVSASTTFSVAQTAVSATRRQMGI